MAVTTDPDKIVMTVEQATTLGMARAQGSVEYWTEDCNLWIALTVDGLRMVGEFDQRGALVGDWIV